MPKIDELMKESKKKKKFKKSEYRPWNYMDEIEKEGKIKQQEQAPKKANIPIKPSKIANIKEGEVNSNQKVISKELLSDKEIENKVKVICTDNEPSLDSIFRLSGQEKKVFTFIIEKCLSRGQLSTGIVTYEVLQGIAETTYLTVKSIIIRLASKGLVNRGQGKPGRGGFYVFNISETIRNAALDYNRMTGIGQQPDNNTITFRTEGRDRSRNLSNQTVLPMEMPKEWLDIDTQPLQNIGFSVTQLHQLYEKKLNVPQATQESIYHFAFGLENSKKTQDYEDPLNVLMGVLRKGGAWTEKGYESPKDRALRELAKRQKDREAKRKEQIKEIREAEFSKWVDSLANDELKAIAPSALKEGRDRLSGMSLGALYPEFEKAIWSSKRKEISEMLGEEI